MKAATGKSIWDGIAIGRLRWFQKREVQAQSISGLTPEEELERFEQARARAQAQLRSLHESAVGEVGEDNAAIFEIHQMMLEDEDFLDAVRSVIRTQRGTAEHAVQVTGENFAAAFAAMEDAYMQARAADVRDVAHRLQAVLAGAEERPDWDEPFILMADDLSPSETVQLDKRKLRGFVTRGGSTNSHTAILARTMGIPALVGVEADPAWDGRMAVLDGYNQCLYVDPAPSLLAAMEARRRADAEQASLLQGLKKKPNVTLDGTEIQVFANIGSDADVGLALQNDAQGIGLFRSEFLYLNSGHPPTEEEQLAVYRRVVETMAGKKVVIRTLDIGADKQVDYFNMEHEENPAMGYRAIRICLDRKEIFKTQLRALCRAAVYGNISIMFPMIISVSEVRKIKEIIAEVKEELRSEGIPFKENVELGVMIETPASVMVSRELAKEVDFFSVGTNDLTQYTLAIDRQNSKLDPFYDPHHPAVLAMIRMAAENAHAEGAWIGICGELGADLELTEEFLKMGLDELSVSPAMVLPLRKRIRECE